MNIRCLLTFSTVYRLICGNDRLQDAILSKEISNTSISDALRSLHLLRSNLHAYNKVIAEVSSSLHTKFSAKYTFHIVELILQLRILGRWGGGSNYTKCETWNPDTV